MLAAVRWNDVTCDGEMETRDEFADVAVMEVEGVGAFKEAMPPAHVPPRDSLWRQALLLEGWLNLKLLNNNVVRNSCYTLINSRNYTNCRKLRRY